MLETAQLMVKLLLQVRLESVVRRGDFGTESFRMLRNILGVQMPSDVLSDALSAYCTSFDRRNWLSATA